MAQQCCCPAITVKCINCGPIVCRKCPAFFVQARNPRGEIVFEGYTQKCGSVRFLIDCDLEYQISVYAPAGFCPGAAHRWVRFSQRCDGYLYFVFCQAPPCCSSCKEILLTDQHYAGLPISKGAIFLWRVPM